MSGMGIFWTIVAAATLAGLAVFSVMMGGGASSEMLASLVIVALLLPAGMIGAGILTILILLCGRRLDRYREAKQVGKAIGGTLVGGLLGIAAMAGIGFAFGAFR